MNKHENDFTYKEEIALLYRIKEGDKEARDFLYENVTPLVITHAARFTKLCWNGKILNNELRNELIQEGFLGVAKSLEKAIKDLGTREKPEHEGGELRIYLSKYAKGYMQVFLSKRTFEQYKSKLGFRPRKKRKLDSIEIEKINKLLENDESIFYIAVLFGLHFKTISALKRNLFNDDAQKKYNKKYYQTKGKEVHKRWYQKNKEKRKKYRKNYYQENQQHLIEYGRKWYKKNREKVLQKYKQKQKDLRDMKGLRTMIEEYEKLSTDT